MKECRVGGYEEGRRLREGGRDVEGGLGEGGVGGVGKRKEEGCRGGIGRGRRGWR